MADPAPDIHFSNGSFINIYNDLPSTNLSLNLPGGPCNYVDLTPGAGGHKCGCRRFWSRTSFGGSQRGVVSGFSHGYEDQIEWCMCSHHACFHHDAPDGQTPISNSSMIASSFINGQENQRPRTDREPLTPLMTDKSFKFPYSTDPHMDFHAAANHTNSIIPTNPFHPTTFSHEDEGYVALNERDEPARDEPLPDTLAWANIIQPGPEEARPSPTIRSQCLMPSQPSSTTSSARMAYLKPFFGKGLETLSGARPPVLESVREERQVTVPEVQNPAEPDLGQSVEDLRTVANTPSTIYTDNTEGHGQSSSPKVDRLAFNLLSNTVQGHEQRIENLESVSFTAAAHDVCHDKHDQTDLRVTELETRVGEIHDVRNEEYDQFDLRVTELETRVGEFEKILSDGPSNDPVYGQFVSTKPWQVQVVFLPFPLRQVWLSPREFGDQRLSNDNPVEADPWTKVPNSYEPQSANHFDWAGPEVDSDWLLARVCVPDHLLWRRLASRGLVKSVTVRGPDARSVQQAMSEAFGTLFRTFSRMQANVHHGSTLHHCVSKFLGLQSPWVPLRKIRKDSRLRFLTPAEMVTPVSWDVQFLSSSVVMKTHDVQRLFITHPEAYLQDLDAYENRWTWQRLRELSRVHPASQNSQETVSQDSQETLEEDASEACWDWDRVLDDPPISSGHASIVQEAQASAQERWRAMANLSLPSNVLPDARDTPASTARRRSTSQQLSPAAIRRSTSQQLSPAAIRRSTSQQLSPAAMRRSTSRPLSPAVPTERRSSKPPRIRTGSVLSLQFLASPASTSKRLASLSRTLERHASSQPARLGQIAKRVKRSSTRSQSLRLRYRPVTPRFTTGSPSPMPEDMLRRATTPAYATPYSNVPSSDARPGRPNMTHIDDNLDFDFSTAESDSDMDVHENKVNSDDKDLDSGADDSDHFMTDIDQDCHESQDGLLPEDEPWPGIEDIESRDADMNVYEATRGGDADVGAAAFNTDEHDTLSQSSSVPSEYPSKEPPWVTGGGEREFRAFEDK
ncbi:hypothetical protein GGS21DRAFT_525038 [Xylaria nigripes]|nr:hypothetical protein GGS21DRAFT_525038 [Xylaria nigripes]